MRFFALVLAVSCLGCASGRLSGRRERVAVARQERDQYCDDDVEQAFPDVLRAVQSAEPLYVSVRLGKSYESRLLGARLWLQARKGWTPQWLERTLLCHQARRALQPSEGSPEPGTEWPSDDSNDAEESGEADPFWLPDSWIDIEVVPEHAAFIAILRVNRVAEGQQVYARAREFVATPPDER